MKLPTVTLEQAKLLKKLGLDFAVQGSYTEYITSKKNKQDGYGGPFGWKKGEVEFSSDYFRNNCPGIDYSCKNYIMYAAPTVALALKWLREEKKVGVFVDGGNEGYTVFVEKPALIIHDDFDAVEGKSTWHKSYEEAESIGLDHALNYLIKP